MKKLFLSILILASISSYSQGISVSYLVPQNGYLAAPVSPISIRDVGFGENIGMQAGFTLYNIPGLSMEKLPFEYDEPLVGPHFALLVPVEGYARIRVSKSFNVKLAAGGFGWWNINTRLNKGNLDRAYRAYKDWDVLNADVDLKDKLGYGWLAGMEFEILVVSNVYLTLGAKYLNGAAKSTLTGSYTGGTESSTITTEQVRVNDAEINLRGMEFSLGVQLGE